MDTFETMMRIIDRQLSPRLGRLGRVGPRDAHAHVLPATAGTSSIESIDVLAERGSGAGAAPAIEHVVVLGEN